MDYRFGQTGFGYRHPQQTIGSGCELVYSIFLGGNYRGHRQEKSEDD